MLLVYSKLGRANSICPGRSSNVLRLLHVAVNIADVVLMLSMVEQLAQKYLKKKHHRLT